MVPLVVALALCSAGLHATWNVLLKGSRDPLLVSTRAVISANVVVAPIACVAWSIAGRPGLPPEAWLLAIVSGLIEFAYFSFLSKAYRLGTLSSVYPMARGTAPLIAIV